LLMLFSVLNDSQLMFFFFYLQILASAQEVKTADDKDLYLDDGMSGDYPVDDDDFNSGSGSVLGLGDVPEETITVKTLYVVPNAEPTRDSTKEFTPKVETSTSRIIPKKPARTESTAVFSEGEENTNDLTSTTSGPPKKPSRGSNADVSAEIRSENLFQRTEVLAAVIAGGVIGFLFAIFLILLLVYRMRKKDEGSYDLGERKPSSAAYQKAPTKEFYA
uniref:Syndecan n=1 Tax=Lepisosteus oculatus TaxID=7918 RepID=W5M6P1_LEPOC